MNLPNKLTILRVILIPFFLVALMVDGIPAGKWIALGIFVLASITDTLDGQIARRKNLVTNFGKFMDPLADKLLVCSAMIAMIDLGRIPCWVVIIIIAREFIISGFRLVASDNGVVIAAGWWGKIKTVVQMIMVIVLIADFGGKAVAVIENVLIYAALALTVISLVDYIIKNKDVISDFK
ncbi:MAG: CDP-diacylglycerol--glycerol-3-phosphate 3-phosphatidyltransferase [Lachnospiraceae bacterium]|nr:CDP-diacylglycerol--glycerol-3-phosphate 3-phosphatidyltransferase [Lachnospiraceae bacterium]